MEEGGGGGGGREPVEKLLEQGQHIVDPPRIHDSSPGHTGGRRAVSPLRHPCSLSFVRVKKLDGLSHDKPKGR